MKIITVGYFLDPVTHVTAKRMNCQCNIKASIFEHVEADYAFSGLIVQFFIYSCSVRDRTFNASRRNAKLQNSSIEWQHSDFRFCGSNWQHQRQPFKLSWSIVHSFFERFWLLFIGKRRLSTKTIHFLHISVKPSTCTTSESTEFVLISSKRISADTLNFVDNTRPNFTNVLKAILAAFSWKRLSLFLLPQSEELSFTWLTRISLNLLCLQLEVSVNCSLFSSYNFSYASLICTIRGFAKLAFLAPLRFKSVLS